MSWKILNYMAHCENAFHYQRFLPSEFGSDADRMHAVEPLRSTYTLKARTRRMIEAEKIPYTIVSSNLFSGFFLPTLAQTGASGPPKEKVVILGDGNLKGTNTHLSFIMLWIKLTSLWVFFIFVIWLQ